LFSRWREAEPQPNLNLAYARRDCWPRKVSPSRNRERYRSGGYEVNGFLVNEDGQGLVEYALIIAVIAITAIAAAIFLRDQISNIFSIVGNNLT
jgi:Flp pilus assembly pilin Flp